MSSLGFVYRGVHADHPTIAVARRGVVVPGNRDGKVTPELHNLSDVSADSPFTSWTHSEEVAKRFALSRGPGGVVLRLAIGAPHVYAEWRWVHSPDLWFEEEVLLRGIRIDAEVLYDV